jgi:voltage-gated potassium channel
LLAEFRVIRLPLLALVLLLLGGTLGFHSIEGWSLSDSVYMTVITLATVGFGEVHPLSLSGKYFAIFLIIFGVAAVGWAVGNIFEVLLSPELRLNLWRKRMENTIRQLSGHYIICGYGRMGSEAVAVIRRRGHDCVVVDQNEEVVTKLRDSGVPAIVGDATEDRVLVAAGIERAKGLLSIVAKDSDNLLITLSAKVLNPAVLVVSRTTAEEHGDKILKAGADRVVSPYEIGGRRMAAALLQPAVVEFLDVALHSEDIDIEMEQVQVGARSELGGKSLSESRIHDKTGTFIIAVKDPEGGFTKSPSASTVVLPGSTLVAIGTVPQLAELRKLAEG